MAITRRRKSSNISDLRLRNGLLVYCGRFGDGQIGRGTYFAARKSLLTGSVSRAIVAAGQRAEGDLSDDLHDLRSGDLWRPAVRGVSPRVVVDVAAGSVAWRDPTDRYLSVTSADEWRVWCSRTGVARRGLGPHDGPAG